MWVRNNSAFEPIVDERDFYTAQGIILERHHRLSDNEMLSRLRELLTQHGRLSALIIDEAGSGPSSAVYRHRFGSLVQAYQAIEYTPDRDLRFLEVNRRLRRLYPEVMAETVTALEAAGGHVERDPETDLLTINGLLSSSIVLARAQPTPRGSLRWAIRFDQGLRPDLTVAVRMDAANECPLDYFVFSALDLPTGRFLAEANGLSIDAYRFDSLDFFYGIAEQVNVEEAA
jgi:hypothetical protein